MSQSENSFKNSLRNFQSTRSNNAGIALPTTPNSTLQSFRETASNAFSNVSSSVQGYIPLGGNTEEEEDPWYQLSRVEVCYHSPFSSLFFLYSTPHFII